MSLVNLRDNYIIPEIKKHELSHGELLYSALDNDINVDQIKASNNRLATLNTFLEQVNQDINSQTQVQVLFQLANTLLGVDLYRERSEVKSSSGEVSQYQMLKSKSKPSASASAKPGKGRTKITARARKRKPKPKPEPEPEQTQTAGKSVLDEVKEAIKIKEHNGELLEDQISSRASLQSVMSKPVSVEHIRLHEMLKQKTKTQAH